MAHDANAFIMTTIGRFCRWAIALLGASASAATKAKTLLTNRIRMRGRELAFSIQAGLTTRMIDLELQLLRPFVSVDGFVIGKCVVLVDFNLPVTPMTNFER
jgi:hypothetical protein